MSLRVVVFRADGGINRIVRCGDMETARAQTQPGELGAVVCDDDGSVVSDALHSVEMVNGAPVLRRGPDYADMTLTPLVPPN